MVRGIIRTGIVLAAYTAFTFLSGCYSAEHKTRQELIKRPVATESELEKKCKQDKTLLEPTLALQKEALRFIDATIDIVNEVNADVKDVMARSDVSMEDMNRLTVMYRDFTRMYGAASAQSKRVSLVCLDTINASIYNHWERLASFGNKKIPTPPRELPEDVIKERDSTYVSIRKSYAELFKKGEEIQNLLKEIN